jgi:hypothetical protein
MSSLIPGGAENAPEDLTFTNLGSGDIYYGLYSDMHLRAFNLTSKQLLGDWELNHFPETLVMRGETIAAWPYIDRAQGGDSDPLTAAEKQILDLSNPAYRQKDTELEEPRFYGCLSDHPLRYGDINGDGSSELVMWLAESLVVFAPQSKKVIFGAEYYFEDIMRPPVQESEAKRHKDELLEMGNNAPQIFAASGTDQLADVVVPAVRSLAKVYFGDFNNDNKHDIVVWRKLYGSRTVGDSTQGYEKQGDALIHYSFENGTYKKQTTESADVKAWLTSKNLTWSKGYPNKSECAGQTNQLIPEMHDPLLNDPEVLQ